MQAIELSLVIPTYNERANISPLLSELGEALADTAWEAVFVDDSNDGTDQVIAAVAAAHPRVRLLHPPIHRGGLSGAVVVAFAEGRGPYVCQFDACFPHPPNPT